MSDIEFVGLVVRTTAGDVQAIDLRGENLKLRVNIGVPVDDDGDLTLSGAAGRTYIGGRDRVSITIDGLRRSSAHELFTLRVVEDGEVPFPAMERAQ